MIPSWIAGASDRSHAIALCSSWSNGTVSLRDGDSEARTSSAHGPQIVAPESLLRETLANERTARRHVSWPTVCSTRPLAEAHLDVKTHCASILRR